MRKYDGAEKVEYPAKINDEEDASIAHVLFSTPAAAQEAVSKLHAHVFKSALLSVTLKKRLEGLAKTQKKATTKDPPSSKAQHASKNTPATSRANRLIVRNLPFDITEPDLRAVFLPYGPIYSIHIPLAEPVELKDEETGEPSRRRTKGYAFVWYLSKKDAEKALEGANGTKVYAGMADGLVRDKQKKKKKRREEAKVKQKEKERKAKQKGKAMESDEEGDEEEKEESEAEEEHGAERVIAVDWALSKDKWEEVKAKLQEEDAQAEAEAEAEKSGPEADNEGSDEEEGSHIGVHDGSDDANGSQPSDGDSEGSMSIDEDEKPGRPQLPPPEVGTTAFVRNVPFEATEDELRTLYVSLHHCSLSASS